MLINTERTLDEHFILGFIARKDISSQFLHICRKRRANQKLYRSTETTPNGAKEIS